MSCLFNLQVAGSSSSSSTDSASDSSASSANPSIDQLFDQISGGASTISETHFAAAKSSSGLSTSASDALFSQIDTNGNGFVAAGEFANALEDAAPTVR